MSRRKPLRHSVPLRPQSMLSYDGLRLSVGSLHRLCDMNQYFLFVAAIPLCLFVSSFEND